MKRGYALALAFLLTLPCLAKIRTEAALAIDTKADCSLTVSVEDSDYKDDFNDMIIPVTLYRVADVDAAGRFTAVDPFAKVDFGNVGSTATADDWMKLAETAKGCLEGDPAVPEENVSTVNVEKSQGAGGYATGTFEDLRTGMYLVVPADTYNADHTVKYTFTPYLTALPSSEYTLTGSGSEDWDYDTVVGLKAGEETQYGKLNITKVLTNYNETLGRTSFVFQIEGRDETGTVVYSNVISTTHEGTEPKTVILDKIPAGLNVTVTEVYSGASYRVVGSDTDSDVIWSDSAVEAGTAGGKGPNGEAGVTFTNEYDGGNRGGYGVTNQFDSDGNGGWIWENPTTPAEE